ncbi:MAG TPA: hypothetical protein VHB79_00875 [Polyangiaceae bacterium]|nr:hypothetical protein [Polyangiaceae bacterium]
MSQRSILCRALLGSVLVVGFATPAQAQDGAPAAEHAAAQDAHRRALELFDHGQYSEALAEFKRAYNLAPSFRIQYNIGLSQVALGDPAAAVDAFDIYLREGGERIPEPRRKQVEAEVARLSKQLGWLTLEVEEPNSEVTLDGTSLAPGPTSQRLRLNQGKHTVAVRSSDGTIKTQTVQLNGAQEQRLHFDAQHHSGANARSAASTSSVAPLPAAAPPARTVPWLAWSVTGALGVGAGVAGILALNAHADERDAQAKRGVTPAELQDARDKVKTRALVTDVLLAGTVVAAGVSVYLTLKPGQSDERATALVIGAGSLQMRRAF